MSNSDLPEDFRLWPSDPYHLLGVDRDSYAKEIKLAYTRLIKRFKPEHFPEQFRLLREAFDKVHQQAMKREGETPAKSNPHQPDRVHRQSSINPANTSDAGKLKKQY